MRAEHVNETVNSTKYVVAWDLPTRLFHWALVILIVSAWVSFRYSETFSDHLLKWHRWNGLAILTLLVWRVLWGVFGSSTSRFTGFVRSPIAALVYARDLAVGVPRRFLGHNPLGGLVVVALLGVVAVQAGLGLFTVEHNDLTAGPLYRLVSEATTKTISRWHHYVFDWVLLPLVALHITANVFYGVVKREPLIPAMITGRKPAGDFEDARTAVVPRFAAARALALLALAAVLVLGTIRVLAGRLT